MLSVETTLDFFLVHRMDLRAARVFVFDEVFGVSEHAGFTFHRK